MDTIDINDNGEDGMGTSTDIQQPVQDLEVILKRSDGKNPSAADMAALEQALKEHPNLWRRLGDLAVQARTHTLETMVASPALKASVRHGLIQLKRDLGYFNAPVLEQLLIEQIILCWLRLNVVEYQYTSVANEAATWKKRNYWERRLSATQRRYMQAIETLARVRKLAAATPLQVNIGGQQVIAAGNIRAVQQPKDVQVAP
jgi:hypothetical protein